MLNKTKQNKNQKGTFFHMLSQRSVLRKHLANVEGIISDISDIHSHVIVTQQ